MIVPYIETAIALVLIFTILVMFHELGHYLTARAVGIRVEEFAFGFGPRIRRLFKRGDTEYTIRALPLGGFVKLAGMEQGQEDVTDGFQAQSIARRALVIFAGPFASLLLGVVVFIMLGLFWGYEGRETTNRIALVDPQTEAHRVGLRAGDTITEVDGVRIHDGRQLVDTLSKNPGRRLDLLVRRDGSDIRVAATPKWSVSYLGADWTFANDGVGVIGYLYDETPAARAGLLPDDRLVSINGSRIDSGPGMLKAIEAAGPRTAHIVVKRGGQTVQADAAPSITWVSVGGVRWTPQWLPSVGTNTSSAFKYTDVLLSVNGREVRTGEQFTDALKMSQGDKAVFVVNRDGAEKSIPVTLSPSGGRAYSFGYYASRGRLGFQLESKLEDVSVGTSIVTGLQVPLVFIAALRHLNPKKDIGGPLMITKMTSVSVARGLRSVIFLLGALSMSLAFINLVPIPIVDGGHLVLLAIERLRRKRLTAEQMGWINMVGFVILVVLFVAIMSSDISKLAQGLVPQ